jgi:dienelactone hydrolase
MHWRGNSQVTDGIVERGFEVAGPAGTVPGVLWTPEWIPGPFPLVLLGYGGGGHMRDGSRVWQASVFTRQYGLAAASIDLLGHGTRALPDGKRPDYGLILDDIVGEWRAALDALCALPEIDAMRVGYRGVSMGTDLGLPLIAAEPRIRAAVLGAAGAFDDEPNLLTGIGARLREDAPNVRCPVLFGAGWDDEIVPRDSAFELFGLLGSERKELRVYPGGHGHTPPPWFPGGPRPVDEGLRWLADILRAEE